MKNRIRRSIIAIAILLICVISANAQQPARHTNGMVLGGYATAPTSPAPRDGQFYYNNVDKKLYRYNGTDWGVFLTGDSATSLNTGVTTGGEVTINADPTKIDIAAGTGYIADWTDPANPTFTEYSWGAQIGVAIPDISQAFTNVYMVPSATPNIAEPSLSSGTIITPDKTRTCISLQAALHLNGVSIGTIANSSTPSYQQINAVLDYIYSLGTINKGNNYLESGANLEIDKTTGESVLPFINRSNSLTNPTELTNGSIVATTLIREYRDGVGGWTIMLETTVNPDLWDDGSGTLVAVQNNKFTIQRFYFFGQTEATIITYGQAEYSSLAEAEGEIFHEAPELDPILEGATFTTALIMKKGVTDLTVAVAGGTASFVNIASAFSSPGGGSVGNFVTSDTDQLTGLTGNKTWESVWKFKNPSVSDDDIVVEVQNNADVTTFSVTGTGAITNGTDSTNDAWAGTNLGYNNVLTAASSVGGVAGENSNVNGYASWGFGSGLDIDGDYIYGMGTLNSFQADYTGGIANNSFATAEFAKVFGSNLYARALGEIAMGNHNTDYTPNSTVAFHPLDRAWSFGIGELGFPLDGIVLLHNGNIAFTADLKAESYSVNETLGETVVAGDVLFLEGDGKYWIADAIDEDTSASELVIASESGVADDVIKVYTEGNLSGFSSLTSGARYYIEVGGGITDDRSSFSSGNISRYIGTAKSATELKFNPDGTYIEIF